MPDGGETAESTRAANDLYYEDKHARTSLSNESPFSFLGRWISRFGLCIVALHLRPHVGMVEPTVGTDRRERKCSQPMCYMCLFYRHGDVIPQLEEGGTAVIWLSKRCVESIDYFLSALDMLASNGIASLC